MTVYSLSVPSHTTRSRPAPHVVYLIELEDTSSSTPIPIYRRYSAVAKLNEQLLKEVHVPPPYPIPPKTTYSFRGAGEAQQPLTSAVLPWSWLDDTFLEERRKGLERYLRGLVQGKIPVWTESRAWKDFVGDDANVELAGVPGVATPSARPAAVSKVEIAKPAVHQATAAAIKVVPSPIHGKKPSAAQANASPYYGANSYYLHTLPDTDRYSILSTLAQAGFGVVRIFINAVAANNKGSQNAAMNDVETGSVGHWDDSVLEAIDSMMVECKEVGIQLIIALHDRYSLGFWEVDVYATTYGVVPYGTSGSPQVADASAFYTSTAAATAFDNRINHILSHQNAKMNNTPWSQLGDVIYAIEPQNESQGHMNLVNPTWANDRAATIKTALGPNSGILVSNGGGVDVTTSTNTAWAFGSNFDIVCVHDYGTTPWSSLPIISAANGTAKSMGKSLLFEEWGAMGASKASVISNYVQACNDYNIPWAYWEVVIPGAGAANYEVWTTEPSWAALTSGG